MRNILIGLLVIGTCGIANTLPITETSTSTFQTASSSTEKITTEVNSVLAEKKGEKEIPQTTPTTNNKIQEHQKSTTEEHSNKGLGVTLTTPKKNEVSTSPRHNEETKEPPVTPSSNKAVSKEPITSSPSHEVKAIASSTLNHNQEETTITASIHKAESTTPSATGQKGSTTIKPANGDKEKKPNNSLKPTRTSTAYLDEGKVIIFNGICGPEGCEIKGDIYDELVPLTQEKKRY